MKKLVLTAVLVVLLAGTCPAEGAKPILYAGGGIALPMTPGTFDALGAIGMDIGIRDMYKSGYNFGGGIGVQVSPTVEIIGRVGYSSFPFDDEGFSDAIIREFERAVGFSIPGLDINTEVSGGELKVLEFMGDIKFLIPTGGDQGTFRPFLLGGIGISNVKIAESEWTLTASYMGNDTSLTFPAPSESHTKLAFNFGAGFDLMVSPSVGVFAEGRYAQVAVSGDPIGYLPIRGGVKVLM